ncbi:MAG: hypothetical protein IIB54_15890 [Planctomycetes bacterium]|nr:hypothetical protein [Planctomycetota bacterium]
MKYNRGDTAGDIDVFACCDGELIFAECKTLADISDDSTSWKPITEQFLELAELAIELRIGAVLLAAQVDRYPDDVKQDINDRLGNRIPHLLLDRSDLEAGHRIVKQEPDRRMQLLDFLSNPFPEAPLERRTSGDRTIDFGYMVYKRGR